MHSPLRWRRIVDREHPYIVEYWVADVGFFVCRIDELRDRNHRFQYSIHEVDYCRWPLFRDVPSVSWQEAHDEIVTYLSSREAI